LSQTYNELNDLWENIVPPCYSNQYDEYNYAYYKDFDLLTAHQFMDYFDTACYLIEQIDDMTLKHKRLTLLTAELDLLYEKYEEIESIITGMLPDVLDNDHIHDFEFKRAWSTSDKHKTVIEMVE